MPIDPFAALAALVRAEATRGSAPDAQQPRGDQQAPAAPAAPATAPPAAPAHDGPTGPRRTDS
ncbi:hypothetical protein [Streptomyces sp. CC228A]|uniref:hypothetical protein n=1 Tax=Streptomyces sp. CC228A TaxID=2898186 RepID=UPI001F2A36D9|nr:hypothetical protein [Streptomyces sp. CC228A]